jgi:hypothetical protein
MVTCIWSIGATPFCADDHAGKFHFGKTAAGIVRRIDAGGTSVRIRR